MNYHAYELAHALLSPLRFGAQTLLLGVNSPLNPLSMTPMARSIAAACQVFENVTRRYGKPEFGITETKVAGYPVAVMQRTLVTKPFCSLVRFERGPSPFGERGDPKVLLVAPMSGHYATLLRNTVKTLVPDHDVYITDWTDARDVPLIAGSFDLDDFITYVMEFIRLIGPGTHVISVCQPGPAALAATALLAEQKDPCQPASLTLMGGPIDTRRNPTSVNKFAEGKPLHWFENNVLSHVPVPNPGAMRRVYPGFMQLTGFMSMNLDRHLSAHIDLFNNLVRGDCDSVKQHQDFYDDYMAVMDLTAEYYLETVRTVFQEHALPRRRMTHRGHLVDCDAIENTTLMTIEGQRDDICGLDQTRAAHDLCTNLPAEARYHHVQEGVGHFGLFNGTRWRTEIAPRIAEMIRTVESERNGPSKPPVLRLIKSNPKTVQRPKAPSDLGEAASE